MLQRDDAEGKLRVGFFAGNIGAQPLFARVRDLLRNGESDTRGCVASEPGARQWIAIAVPSRREDESPVESPLATDAVAPPRTFFARLGFPDSGPKLERPGLLTSGLLTSDLVLRRDLCIAPRSGITATALVYLLNT